MKRFLTAAAASLLLTLVLVAPAGAAGPGGCSEFGAATASLTRTAFPWGQTLSGFARQGLVSTIVLGEHADPKYCVQH